MAPSPGHQITPLLDRDNPNGGMDKQTPDDQAKHQVIHNPQHYYPYNHFQKGLST
jgi:hypothetical protein